MEPSETTRLARRLYLELVDLPAEARTAALDRACKGDAALRAMVDALLAAERAAGGGGPPPAPAAMVANPAARAAAGAGPCGAAVAAERPGAQIGRYQLLEQIGEGGMGTIWLAEQREPVRRRVALKIIKLGMDTKQVIARFEVERQALALMDHPNIAKVFDAGATESGRPYFAMEHIKGVPIVAYCDREKLSTTERLQLFTSVCHAIQHAHGKGVIHRDIKPSNVLVTLHDGVPVCKVIDFGIAKATGGELTAKTLFTEHHQIVGTPAYMSPEQAEFGGLDVDTRSDVYSLGALLYELLTGTTPFDVRGLLQSGYDEMMKAIREVDPHKPSTRISSLGDTGTGTALLRRVEPRKLSVLLRGDIDWIVMKCLEKDRARRYEPANGLAMDIRRHLAGEPVLAAPPGVGYRLRKFARRHWAKLAVAGLFGLALVGGAIGTTVGMVRAVAAQERADVEARKAASAARFALSFFHGINPDVARGADTTLLSRILDDARQRVATELADQPEVEAQIRATLGRAYTSIDRFDDAGRELAAAELLCLRSFGEQDRRTIDVRRSLGGLLSRRGRDVAAAALQQATVAQANQALGAQDRAALTAQSELGDDLMRQGKYRDGEALLRATLAEQRRLFGADDADSLRTQVVLGQLLNQLGHGGEACELLQQALDRQQQALGPDAPAVIRTLDALGTALRHAGRGADSEAAHRRALELARRVHGPEGQQTLNVLNNLGGCLYRLGRNAEAETLLRECLAIRERKFGPEHKDTLSSRNSLADLLAAMQRQDEARAILEATFPVQRRVLGDGNAVTEHGRHLFAVALRSAGRHAEAAELLRQRLEVDRQAIAAGDPSLGISAYNWAATLQDAGMWAEAEAALRELVAAVEAHGWHAQPFVPAAWNAFAKSLAARGEHGEADRWFGKALQARRERHATPHVEVAYSLRDWSSRLLERSAFDLAEPMLRELLTLRRQLVGPSHRSVVDAKLQLGRCLAALRRFAEGEQLLLDACAAYEAMPAPAQREAAIRDGLAPLYEAWEQVEPGKGHAVTAAAWRAKLPDGAVGR
ncbi:MAG: tetratricopeptide repeat protein [Planctomycetota bacterium]|jgi:hypothetical protein